MREVARIGKKQYDTCEKLCSLDVILLEPTDSVLSPALA